MNWELKLALMRDGRPAFVVATKAGLSPSALSRIVRGHRAASDVERSALARTLKREESALFSQPASQAA